MTPNRFNQVERCLARWAAWNATGDYTPLGAAGLLDPAFDLTPDGQTDSYWME